MKKFILFAVLLFLTSVSAADTKWVGAVSGLNMREKPDANSDKIITIPFKAQVKVLETKSEELFLAGTYGHWSKIMWEKYEGWVFGGYLKDFNPAEFEKFILKYINNMYAEYYSGQTEMNRAGNEKLWNHKAEDIKILLTKKNLIIVSHYQRDKQSFGAVKGCSAFYFHNNKWNYSRTVDKVYLCYINNDKNPDMILLSYDDLATDVYIYLSDNSGNCEEIQYIELLEEHSISVKNEESKGNVNLIITDFEGKKTTLTYNASKEIFEE